MLATQSVLLRVSRAVEVESYERLVAPYVGKPHVLS